MVQDAVGDLEERLTIVGWPFDRPGQRTGRNHPIVTGVVGASLEPDLDALLVDLASAAINPEVDPLAGLQTDRLAFPATHDPSRTLRQRLVLVGVGHRQGAVLDGAHRDEDAGFSIQDR